MEPLFTAYNARFASMPPAGAGSTAQWYSVNAGPVHFVTLNSFNAYGAASAQYTWLMRDLAAVDRAVTPWIIVQLQ